MNKKLILISVVFWLVASALAILVYPVLMSDTMNRYAPMAEAFAAGDWFHAFHPRFGIIFSILTGGLSFVTSLRGDYSCQVVAIGFLAASMIPAWHIARRVWGETAAWYLAAFIALLPEFFNLSIDGLRDTARIFASLMIAYSFISGKRSWVMAIGLFVFATLRIDTQIVGAVVVSVWSFMALKKGDIKSALAPAAAYIVGMLLCSIMVYAFTGWFFPNAHTIHALGIRL